MLRERSRKGPGRELLDFDEDYVEVWRTWTKPSRTEECQQGPERSRQRGATTRMIQGHFTQDDETTS